MPHTLPRPHLLLALAATVLAALAVMASAPGAAQAGDPNCDLGDFCLWEHVEFNGGRYNWSGNDSNLWNDHWVGGSGGIVARQASALVNHGRLARYDDVAMYDGGAFIGCVPRGIGIANLVTSPWGNINDRITGFRWVASC